MRVAIIGGGLSGTLACMQLLQRTGGRVRISLVERRSRQLNRGVAYSAHLSQQLLNVPAGRMGLSSSDADGFLRWVRTGPIPRAEAGDFLPRKLFGDFVHEQFHAMLERYPHAVEMVRADAVAIEHHPANGYEVKLHNGRSCRADVVLLAMGNAPPAHVPHLEPTVVDDPAYIPWPWQHGALGKILPGDRVLFVGSGLTMVDLLLSLRDQGHSGPVTVVSRRGFLPCPHTGAPAHSFVQQPPATGSLTVSDLLRWLRREVELAKERGTPWQSVMDAVKPLVQGWWRALPHAERGRFLRHVRPFWEVHRHRMPAEVHERLMRMQASGDLRILDGHVTAVRPVDQGLEVRLQRRKSDVSVLITADRLINCTGPQADSRRIEQPLLKDLLHQGLAIWDELHLGLKVSADGGLVNATGRVSDSLFAIGPLCKAALWECTAVPEIREQAAQLADLLTDRSRSRRPAFVRLFDRLALAHA